MKNIAITYIDTTVYTVEIITDQDPESPREWDNLGTMICGHRNYTLGDEQITESDFDGWEDLEKSLYRDRGAALVLPLNLYDHSGITMSIGSGSGWDNGVVGFIYTTRDAIRHEYGVKRITRKILEQAERVLRGEVETYDTYLRGDVYGVIITDAAGREIENCWGFYGDAGAQQAIIDAIPDALDENVTITGRGYGGDTYDVYFDYADCKKAAGRA